MGVVLLSLVREGLGQAIHLHVKQTSASPRINEEPPPSLALPGQSRVNGLIQPFSSLHLVRICTLPSTFPPNRDGNSPAFTDPMGK